MFLCHLAAACGAFIPFVSSVSGTNCPSHFVLKLWSRALLCKSFVLITEGNALTELFARMVSRIPSSFARIKSAMNTSSERSLFFVSHPER